MNYFNSPVTHLLALKRPQIIISVKLILFLTLCISREEFSVSNQDLFSISPLNFNPQSQRLSFIPIASSPFPKFLLLSLKPKDFVSRNFLTLGFSHLTQFLGKVPHLISQRGWHWPLDLFDFKMNRNQQKGKKKIPHIHLTLTYSHSPGTASGLAVWITSGYLIHP